MARSRVIIPDRAEFIDALRQLRRGSVLARSSAPGERCLLEGQFLRSAFVPLSRFSLIEEVGAPDVATNIRYYRLSERGQDFADRAWADWRRRPLLQRLAVRLTG
jgi:hypothetical protein